MGTTGTRGELVAAEVRAELARQRLTHQWLAEHAHIKLRTLVRRLNGPGKSFDLDELQVIARALDVPIDRLIGEQREEATV